MIERINTFQSWIATIVTSALGVITGFFLNKMSSNDEQIWLILLSVIVLIVIIEKSLTWIIGQIIGKSILLRKMLLDNHFIEGYWVEVVVGSDDPKTKYGYGLIKIFYENFKYHISGEIFNADCTDSIGAFKSNYSDYSNYSLKYFFDGINIMDSKEVKIFGSTEFMFMNTDGYPTRFKGQIIDTKNHSALKVEAEKLDKEILNKFGTKDEDNSKKIVKHYIKKWENPGKED